MHGKTKFKTTIGRSKMQRLIQVPRGRCPQCGSSELVRDEDMGEIVCSKCGLVIVDDILDRSPEWRAFTLEEKRNKQRAGPPTDYTHYDKGFTTTMWITRDAFGRPLTSKTRQQMWRLKKWQIRSQMVNKGRNLMQAMSEIRRLSEKLYIPPSVQKMAAIFYRKALDKGLVRGRSIASIAAAALYAACRRTETPRRLDEVVETSVRDKKEVSRCYRLLILELNMNMPIPDPLDYISKIAETAHVSYEAQGLAVRILREAERKHVTVGKDPMGIAAAVLYIACQLKGEEIFQKEIAEAANITEVTIRNRKKDLMKKLDLIPRLKVKC
jgi:transcription initiation factor TFIIB